MHRRSFFSLLSLFGFGPATPQGNGDAAPTRVVLQRSPVRGFRHRHPLEFLHQLRPGLPLTLRAEPDNPHDHHAVMVLWQDHHLGYLPREDNTHASRLLRQGLPLDAILLSIHPDRYEWAPLHIEVAFISSMPTEPSGNPMA